VKVVPDLLQVIALRARLEDLDGVPVININDVPLQGFNAIVKRGIDTAISSAMLLVLAIPLGLIAALIKLSSRGDVFYRQERMGLDGRPFMIYKFRSMYDDAEAETGPVFASEQDPRRTPLGKLLRRSNVDELPQLWNVLRGDMSIVGPRPEQVHYVELFEDAVYRYPDRHRVKSGLTGWSQVNGLRGETSLADRIEWDNFYIENWSPWLDLKILVKTIPALVAGRGAR
jgi:exopolysaccharide biosynthesis polyprenyl glycosylphosphotransferase